MKKVNTIVGMMLLLALPLLSQAQFLTDKLLFTARLDGNFIDSTEESDARGVATLILNSTRDTMCLSVAVSGIEDSITAFGIYDGSTVNDSIAVDLLPSLQGTQVTHSLTGLDVTAQRIVKFLRGDYSIIVTSVNHPGGLIGGRIHLETDMSFFAVMNAANETDSSSSIGYGLAVFELKIDTSFMKVNCVVQGLSDVITGAHLHFGKPGVSGPVVVDLTSLISGNVIGGVIDSSDVKQILDSLLAGNVYINVHTATYPNGEIRGQLVQDHGVAFHSELNGDSQVPPVTTDGYGIAHVAVNSTLDTLSLHVVVTGLSGAISGAHFHYGEAGVNGPVLVDLTSYVNGFMIDADLNASQFPDTLLRNMLENEIYLNVHTSLHPDGEIRDQVKRYNYEGFTFVIDGSQENPPVVTPAVGSGFVSISPARDLLHFMFAVEGLSDTASEVHFNEGAFGENGPSIFNLTPYLDQYVDSSSGEGFLFAEGYWNDQGANGLSTSDIVAFSNDSVYLNVSTSFAPDGEIRGQVMHGSGCFELNTGVNEVMLPFGQTSVYPNPVTDVATLHVESDQSEKFSIQIADITGKILWKQDVNWPAGTHEQILNFEKYVPGLYFIIVKTNNQSIVQKVEKM